MFESIHSKVFISSQKKKKVLATLYKLFRGHCNILKMFQSYLVKDFSLIFLKYQPISLQCRKSMEQFR